MSIAGQRQKYYVRIQSIGTARNLYTVFTLETKNHFRADSDKKNCSVCMGKGDIQESYSDRVQDGIMACMRSTSTTSTASTTLRVLPLHASQVYLRPLSINERSARMGL